MPHPSDQSPLREKIRNAVHCARLVETARRLIGVRSITGEAGDVSDLLAELLTAEGFDVTRPTGGHPQAPAVAVRWRTRSPGPVIQFDGHLDTVHLPFVPPSIQGDVLHGSGSSDMKAGLAAAIEALRVLRETEALPCGEILLTAHDLHEAPWGDGGQLNQLIEEGYCGDAVLIPEYTRDSLPIIGRGNSVFRLTVTRPGAPVHEVYRPLDEPNPVGVLAELVQDLHRWGQGLAQRNDPLAGHETLFLGQMHVGEIYNQLAKTGWLEGTRRWLPGRTFPEVRQELEQRVAHCAAQTKADISLHFQLIRDAFELPVNTPIVHAFDQACTQVMGAVLPRSAKPFVDDGSCFWNLKQIPTITHGPRAGGAHTLEEWVSISDLCRVAEVYALTAAQYATACSD